MASYIMYFILIILIILLVIFIYTFTKKLLWHNRLKRTQNILGKSILTNRSLSLKSIPILLITITTILFVSNGTSIAVNIFPSPSGSCICAPDDTQCILNSNEDISIITIDNYYDKIEYNPFNINSYQYYDSVFFEFTTEEVLRGNHPVSNIVGQWIPIDPKNSVGCETNIKLEEGKTYMIIGGNLTERDIESFTNNFQHIKEDHYWVGFIIELENYDSTKPFDQQSQEVQDEIENYMNMIE